MCFVFCKGPEVGESKTTYTHIYALGSGMHLDNKCPCLSPRNFLGGLEITCTRTCFFTLLEKSNTTKRIFKGTVQVLRRLQDAHPCLHSRSFLAYDYVVHTLFLIKTKAPL